MTRRVTSCVLAGAVIAVTGVVLFGGTTPTEEAVPFIEGLRQFLVPSSQGWPTAEVTYRIQYSNGGLLTVDEAAWFEQDRWQRGTPGATVYDEGSVRVIAFLEDPASGTRGGSGPAAWHARLLPGVPQRVEAAGIALEIPPAALEDPTTITLEPLEDAAIESLDPGMLLVPGRHAGFRLGPDGSTFPAALLLRLGYDPDLLPAGTEPEAVRTYYFDTTAARWIPMAGLGPDTTRKEIASITDHFTDFINATLALPDSPTPDSFDLNAIKGIQSPDPAERITLIDAPQGDSTGLANLRYPLDLPPGRQRMQPDLKVTYASAPTNGWLGLGWDLRVPSVEVDTRFGVPRYDASNETETYLLDGAQLAPVANRLAPAARLSERVFTQRVEGAFHRIIRHGSSPSNYWWEVTSQDGVRRMFGLTGSARLADYGGSGATYRWYLEQVKDPSGNTVDYTYHLDSGTSGEPFRQLYPKQIDYTGVNGSGAHYHVKFVLDAAGTRLDAFSSARPGFKVYTRHLLDHVDILAGTDLVRRYQFLYTTGDFQKSLLQHVVVYGKGAATELTRHTFDYFAMPKQGSDFDAFTSPSVWGTVGSGRGLSRQEDLTASGHLFAAVGPTSCDPHVGVGAGYTRGTDTTRSLFLDVNGDGLPDRLRDSGTVDLNFLNATRTAGGFTGGAMGGVSSGDLGHSTTDALNFQAAVHLNEQSVVSTNYSWSHANEDRITADVDGDGYPDLVDVAGSSFGVKQNNGTSFAPSAAWSGYSLASTNFTDPAEVSQVTTDFNRTDTLLRWTAPFAGTVDVTGPITRKAGGGDGVDAKVFHNGTLLWARTFTPSDLAACTPGPSGTCGSGLLGISVAAGDRLYFLTDAISDTALDALLWAPRVTYVGVSLTLQEPYGPKTFDFDHGLDFRLAGPPTMPWVADTTGTVSISGSVIKLPTPDNVVARIVKNGTTVVTSATLLAGTATIVPMTATVSVAAQDTLLFEVLSDSPLDPLRVLWSPLVTYTVYTRTDPATGLPVSGAVTCAPDPSTGALVCTMVGDPVPDAPLDPEAIIQPGQVRYPVYRYAPGTATTSYIAPATGTVRLFGTIQKTGVAPPVKVYIQGVNTLHYKRIYAATDVGDTPPTLTHDFTISVTAGDQLFFTVASDTTAAPTNVTWAPSVQYLSPAIGTFSPPVNVRSRDPAEAAEPMSGGFHQWFYGVWNGDVPFAESGVALPSSSSSPNTSFSPMAPRRQGVPGVSVPLWVGRGTETYLGGGEARPARLGTNVGPILTGSGISALRKALGKNFSVGVGYVGGVALSFGHAIGQLDFMDMNGDRYPDQLRKDATRFSNGATGFGGTESIPAGFGDLRKTEQRNLSLSLGQGWLVNKITPESAVGRLAQFLPSIGAHGGISSTQVDFIDVNGDGLPDHVRRTPGGSLQVRLNLGYRFGAEETWVAPSWVNSDIRAPLGMLSLSAVDTDTNVLRYGNNVGVNIGFGFGGLGVGIAYGVTRSLVDFVDLNGDGLPERVMKLPGEAFFRVQQNLGDRFEAERKWLAPAWGVTLGNATAATVFGTNDTIQFSESITGNAGFGFPIYIPIPIAGICIVIEPSISLSKGRLESELGFQDLDGDGTADHVLKLDGSGSVHAKLNRLGKTNLLRTVTRPLGGAIRLDYQREGNRVDSSVSTQKVDMPGNQWVLSSVTAEDGLGNSYTNAYEYFTSGFHDRGERVDFGYARVRETRPDGSTATHRYHNQDLYRQGLLAKRAIADASGNLFTVETWTYDLRNVQSNSNFPALTTKSLFYYEGTTASEAAFLKSKTETFDYDSRGNVTSFTDGGDEGSADDVVGTIAYAEDLTSYLIQPDLLEVEDAGGTLLRKRTGIYDSAGRLTGLTRVLVGGNDPATGGAYTGSTNPSWSMEYDTYGNLKKMTDPAGYVLNYEYDTTVHTHITQVTDSFGFTSTTLYDLSFGLPTDTTDLNGNLVRRTYDAFGRLAAVRGPYDIGATPTLAFEHHPEGSPPHAIARHKDVGTTDTIDTATFIDGLRREIQTKKDVEIDLGSGTSTSVGMAVSGKLTFDAVGRIAQQGQRVFSTAAAGTFVTVALANPIAFEYDGMGRRTKLTEADGTDTTMSYGFASLEGVTRFRTTVTDDLGRVRHVYRSVRDEVLAVREFNTLAGTLTALTTRYTYNPLKELLKVEDANGNETKFTYDTVGQRVEVDSLDGGVTEYRFTLGGDLGAKIPAILAAGGAEIAYARTYHRLDGIDYPVSPDVAYTYGGVGASFNRVGRIATVEDESGIEERFYGKLGEVVKTVRTMNSKTPTRNGETYEMRYAFDSFGRLLRVTYPDGEMVSYAYNAGGLVESVSGDLRGLPYAYVVHSGYDVFEDQKRLVYGNGVETKYGYDAQRRWLVSVSTTAPSGAELLDLKYAYDSVGNVLGADNDVPVPTADEMGGPTSQTFAYDDLDQLTSASGSYDFAPGKQNAYALDHTYDAIGNLVSKDQVNTVTESSGQTNPLHTTTYSSSYTYGSSRPHAATAIGERTYSYDASGNLTGWDDTTNGTRRRIVWTEENRVRSVADNGQSTRFLYDADGVRTHKREDGGGGGETVYANRFYTIRNREVPSKHIFAGSVRVATKIEWHDNQVTICHAGQTKHVGSEAALRFLLKGATLGACPGDVPDGPPAELHLWYYHADQLGSSAYITDAEGATFQHLEYFPTGEAWVDEHSTTHRVPYYFNAQELDEETGLYYFGARYYMPVEGLWLNPDPVLTELPDPKEKEDLLEPVQLALYTYARNNPLKFVDPDGRLPLWVGVILGALWGALSNTEWFTDALKAVINWAPVEIFVNVLLFIPLVIVGLFDSDLRGKSGAEFLTKALTPDPAGWFAGMIAGGLGALVSGGLGGAVATAIGGTLGTIVGGLVGGFFGGVVKKAYLAESGTDERAEFRARTAGSPDTKTPDQYKEPTGWDIIKAGIFGGIFGSIGGHAGTLLTDE